MDSLDPDLAGGYKELCCIDNLPVTVKLRGQETMAMVRLRVMLLGDEYAPTEVKVTVTTDEDIFFHFYTKLSQADFAQMQ